MEYVGFWSRVGATIIDAIIVWVITLPILAMIYGAAYWHDTKLVHGPAEIIVGWIFPIVATVWLWVATGQTPGKMVIGARVVDAETGERLGVGQAVGRYLSYFLSMIGLFVGIHLGWAGSQEARVARSHCRYRCYSQTRSPCRSRCVRRLTVRSIRNDIATTSPWRRMLAVLPATRCNSA
jgi:uncharacterized RDD family membrane protein YckC